MWLLCGTSCRVVEMRIHDACEDALHPLIVRLEFFNRLFNCRNEILLSISSHLGVHSIAFSSVTKGRVL